MDSVCDHVRSDAVIAEHFADDAGIAMIQRAHGIEGVGGVPGTGCNSLPGLRHLRIGVPDAYTNAATSSLRNQLDRSGNLRRDSHHAHVPASGLPESIEN